MFHGPAEGLSHVVLEQDSHVATPNHLHYPVVLAAAAAGKHVLCEKPMALRVAEAEEIVAACRGAGVLGGLGVHVIDFVGWILGDRIARVFGLAYPGRETGRPEESVTLVLEFAGGCQAGIRCGRGLPIGTNDLQAFGTRGMLGTGPLRRAATDSLTVKTVDGTEEREFPRENLYQREIEALAEELAGNRTAAATGEDGLRLTRVTDALIRSFEAGALVSVEQ